MNAQITPLRPPAGARSGTLRHRVRPLLLAGVLCAAALGAVPTQAQPAAAARLPAVVVWDFDNQSPGALLPGLAAAGGTDYLRRALSEALTAQLLAVPGLPVVERQRLRDLLAEQKVGSAEIADADARIRLGRIVGAQRMVFGGFFVLGEQLQLNVRVVDSATSRVLFADESTGPLPGAMQQVLPMARRVVRALGGAAPEAVAPAHAESLWQAYDRALALADAGQWDAAIAALQALLAQDKTFTPAERQLVALLEKMARR